MNSLVDETATIPSRVGNKRGSLLSSTSRLGVASYSRETIDQLEAALCQWFSSARSSACTVGYINPHVFNLAWKDQKLRTFLDKCDIVAVDGLGIALAILLLKGEYQTRTVMTQLFDRVLANHKIPPATAILIGGTKEMVVKGAAAINRSSEWLRIETACDGYQPLEAQLQLISENPDCVAILVAMGSPRSEELILAAQELYPGRLFWNIGGGTLHFYAGTQPRVPSIVSVAGLQWLWRIVHEPRIAPRYLLGTPLFLARLSLISILKPSSLARRLW